MFLNEFTHTLDEKGRVVMPSQHRALLAGPVVAAKGLDGCVSVFPADEFRKMAEIELAQPHNLAGRRQARAMFTKADYTRLDSQGRLLLKPELRTHAGLEGETEVVVSGVFTHAEIWNVARFQVEMQSIEASYQPTEERTGF